MDLNTLEKIGIAVGVLASIAAALWLAAWLAVCVSEGWSKCSFM
jgi:hypothetical protein